MILCWAAKGGSGTTVVACALALGSARTQPTALIDLSGDCATALGMDEPTGPGVVDWLASPTAGPTDLFRLAVLVRDKVMLIPRGEGLAPDDQWERLAAAIADSANVIIDAGTGHPPQALHDAAEQSLLVTRPCFIAIRRAQHLAIRPTGIVLVDEPGRSLTSQRRRTRARRSGRGRGPARPRGRPRRRRRLADCPVAEVVDHLVAARSMIDVIAERSPLGGLERWLNDAAINEVIVNGTGEVWIERAGALLRVATMSNTAVTTAIEHILRPIGRRIDRTNPTVDARLPDGSRVCAVIPPVAVNGACLTIRRFAMRPLPLAAFATPDIVELLHELVAARCNVLVSGATSSGKTTLLNALAALVPATERIITLEDIAELRLPHPHVVRLETRPASAEGTGEITLAQLLRTALRMRPDRLVLGEVPERRRCSWCRR